MADPVVSRVERRKLQTRAALIHAAQRIFAERASTEVSIREITDAADVGFGSFYNHFEGKAELFHTAIAEMLEAHAQVLDEAMSGLDDAAARFALGTRLTCRLVTADPVLARVLMNSPASVANAQIGHPARLLADLRTAVDQGRFEIEDVRVAVALVSSCVVGALRLCVFQESMPVEEVADQTTLSLLRMFRMEESEARRLVSLPLPQIASARRPA